MFLALDGKENSSKYLTHYEVLLQYAQSMRCNTINFSLYQFFRLIVSKLTLYYKISKQFMHSLRMIYYIDSNGCT